MQIQQDWNTFRWSRVTLLSDPAAKVLRMNVRVFSIHIVCWSLESRPSNNWATELDEVWNEHDFVEKYHLADREVQLIWHVLPGASTHDIKNYFQRYLDGQNPEFFDERIIFISMFNDIEWTLRSSTETCLPNAKEVEAFAATFKPGHSERDVGGTQIPTNLRENEIMSHCRWLTYSSVTLHSQCFHRQSHHRLDR